MDEATVTLVGIAVTLVVKFVLTKRILAYIVISPLDLKLVQALEEQGNWHIKQI